ncbi:MAG: phosphatidate cytidylyltransferase [Lachnospiraceae bacterium]|nr:phosphatidate cytidylyltransferase [Lachnospiraceae bacterium]
MLRLISGVVMMIILVVCMIFAQYLLFPLLVFVTAVGLMELYRTEKVHKSLLGAVGYLAAAGFYAMVYFERYDLLMVLVSAFIILLMAVYVLTFPKFNSTQVFTVFFGLFYVAVTLSFIYRIRMMDSGAYSVWLVFVGSWGSDTMAYEVGKRIGKHKLAPRLSPKKSVEGFFGGVFGAALIGLIFALIFREKITDFNALIVFPATGACGAVISQIGDMAASGIKRNKDIKDYGKLIPGHGGVLDRFDSVIFIAPICYYMLVLFTGGAL